MNLRMLRMQFGIEQRLFWRNRSGVFFTFILPLAMLVALALSNDPVDHVPLIATLGILSTGFQWMSMQLSMHRDQGVLKRMMATPLPPGTFVLAKVLSTLVVVLVETSIVVAAGVWLFGAPVPVAPFALLGFVVLGTGCFVALGFLVANLTPTSESAPAITNAAYLGLILLSVVLDQADGIAEPLRAAGHLLPLQPLFQGVQHAWIDGLVGGDLRRAIVLAAWAVLAGAWTARRFRWEPSGER